MRGRPVPVIEELLVVIVISIRLHPWKNHTLIICVPMKQVTGWSDAIPLTVIPPVLIDILRGVLEALNDHVCPL